MSVIEHIPTEIVQLLSAADAAAYRLVPCGRDGDLVRFYGCDTKDYTDASEELEVLYGWQTAVEPIAEEDLQRLLLRYYRTERAGATTCRTAETDSGQSFLYSLIGEALSD